MLNYAAGTSCDLAGVSALLTGSDTGVGHALFGPYDVFPAGDYVAEFSLARSAGTPDDGDLLCAILDVTGARGTRRHAVDYVFGSQLTNMAAVFQLAFTLDREEELEFRVRASKTAAIIVTDQAHARIRGGESISGNPLTPQCPMTAQTPDELIGLTIQGLTIRRANESWHIKVEEIWINANTRDDVNFIGEVFFQRAYHATLPGRAVVIDIGMNVGLASLLFATFPYVDQVYSFEPFADTFCRATKNLELNPHLGRKIEARNVGLGDRDEDVTIIVPEGDDSGLVATRSMAHGRPVQVQMRDAVRLLSPIIDGARRAGQHVVLKVDCEGAEFAIFESLTRAGLLAAIDLFMVEWHCVFPGCDQHDMTKPLLEAGFSVIDLTPPVGNGFFYAVNTRRMPPRQRRWWSRTR